MINENENNELLENKEEKQEESKEEKAQALPNDEPVSNLEVTSVNLNANNDNKPNEKSILELLKDFFFNPNKELKNLSPNSRLIIRIIIAVSIVLSTVIVIALVNKISSFFQSFNFSVNTSNTSSIFGNLYSSSEIESIANAAKSFDMSGVFGNSYSTPFNISAPKITVGFIQTLLLVSSLSLIPALFLSLIKKNKQDKFNSLEFEKFSVLYALFYTLVILLFAITGPLSYLIFAILQIVFNCYHMSLLITRLNSFNNYSHIKLTLKVLKYSFFIGLIQFLCFLFFVLSFKISF